MTTVYTLGASANSIGIRTLVQECKLDDVTEKVLDVQKGETRTPEFIKKNPFHCCPTLEDGDLIVWESNAILRYVAAKYKLEAWYPTDLQQRAKVDQVLDYRQTSLYSHLAKTCYPGLGFGGDKDAVEGAIPGLVKELEAFASYYLKDGKFARGFEQPTIADLAIIPALHFTKVLGDKFKYPDEVQAYVDRFDKAVATYAGARAPLDGYLAYLASQ
jgi:glutathione S-transferase